MSILSRFVRLIQYSLLSCRSLSNVSILIDSDVDILMHLIQKIRIKVAKDRWLKWASVSHFFDSSLRSTYWTPALVKRSTGIILCNNKKSIAQNDLLSNKPAQGHFTRNVVCKQLQPGGVYIDVLFSSSVGQFFGFSRLSIPGDKQRARGALGCGWSPFK